MTREERFKLLKTTSEAIKAGKTGVMAQNIEGKPYSAFNQMFLLQQKAPSGVFGGFNQWKASGRMVKKGEHGYHVCFPMKSETDKGEEKTHFAMIAVFHVDQTMPA